MASSSPSQYLVRDIMTHDPITVEVDARLSEAAAMMRQHDVQHLPVTRSGELRGVMSERDLHDAVPSVNMMPDPAAREHFLTLTRVYKVANMEPVTVRLETTVLHAIRSLRRLRAGCLPVVDKDRSLVGIVTSGDFISLLQRILEG